ncbi:Uncharacterised protein [Mycobacteroides abscessus subsp. abscessus]|nr:Uncharacterised protein [Mycobacteroides abscessus subsp. abscessus]
MGSFGRDTLLQEEGHNLTRISPYPANRYGAVRVFNLMDELPQFRFRYRTPGTYTTVCNSDGFPEKLACCSALGCAQHNVHVLIMTEPPLTELGYLRNVDNFFTPFFRENHNRVIHRFSNFDFDARKTGAMGTTR